MNLLVSALLQQQGAPLLSKGDVSGHDFHGNQWTGGGGKKLSEKAQRALATHKPSTKALQDKATAAERLVVSILGGQGTDNNRPVDVTVGKRIGVEVKAMIDNGNNKVTMHPESLARKLDWAKKNRATLHTVVVDTRTGTLYHRDGVGSFRLRNMQQVTPKQLKALIVGKKNATTKGGDLTKTTTRAGITQSAYVPRYAPLPESFALKGDVPGHEFHGNQYTGGTGGTKNSYKGLLSRVSSPDGGFTYSPLDDSEPKKGYALSLYPERSFSTDAEKFSFMDLVRYAQNNNDLLGSSGNYIGGWHDPDTHKVFLDISTVVHSEGEAHHLALSHDQIAYFDLGRGSSVVVNRAATSGGAAHG